MNNKPKILIITPRFPYPEAGADEQDRAGNIRQLQRLGYEVQVIAKFFDWQNPTEIQNRWEKEGIAVTLVPYQYQKATDTWQKKFKKYLFALTHPRYLDGSALEYADPMIQQTVEQVITNWKPHLVWFDYTYLWPLYRLVENKNIPFVVRSINVEARHFLDEDGRSLKNYLKSIPKYLTEMMSARRANVLFSITPAEAKTYHSLGGRRIVNLPLRSLPNILGTHTPRDTNQLHVFFSGSTYTVAHNRRALEFIVKELAPLMYRDYGEKFIFHITGAKLPEDIRPFIINNIVYEGFVKDMNQFLSGMDIAVAPSLFGCGMQQKVFEPLTRGFPTITHARGLAGYDFVPGTDVLVAMTAREFADALVSLQSLSARQALSQSAKAKSQQQFAREVIDQSVTRALEKISR